LNHRSPPSEGGRDSGPPYALQGDGQGRWIRTTGLLLPREAGTPGSPMPCCFVENARLRGIGAHDRTRTCILEIRNLALIRLSYVSMGPTVRIERTSVALQTTAMTTSAKSACWWSSRRDSNPHKTALQAAPSPFRTLLHRLAPRRGFEPRSTASKAGVLPLNDRGMKWWVIGESNSAGVLLRSRPLPEPHPAFWRSARESNPSHSMDSGAASSDASQTLRMSAYRDAGTCWRNRTSRQPGHNRPFCH
jgi:hypothetical protein